MAHFKREMTTGNFRGDKIHKPLKPIPFKGFNSHKAKKNDLRYYVPDFTKGLRYSRNRLRNVKIG